MFSGLCRYRNPHRVSYLTQTTPAAVIDHVTCLLPPVLRALTHR
jgi:hypothetical protein